MASALELIGLLVACGAAAAAILAPRARWQPIALAVALAVAPALVLGDVWDSPRVEDLRGSTGLVAAGIVALTLGVGVGAVVMRRIGWAFPVLVFAALGLRLPVRFGGETSNLLIPLYLVIASQLVATFGADRSAAGEEPRAVVWLRRVLAAGLVLYAIQASYSDDVSNAIENAGFFLVPFAVLFCQIAQFNWDARNLRAAAISIGAVGAAIAVVAIVQFAIRDLILNKELLDSNQIKPFFRVNSVFFDPNVLGRYMVMGIIAMGAAIAWSRGGRAAWGALAAGLVMLVALALSFSLTSVAALLAGLGVLAWIRFGLRGVIASGVAILLTGTVFVLTGGLDRPDIGPYRGFDEETSGRGALLEGGFDLIEEEPLLGWGSGSFGRAYFDQIRKTRTTASHSEPINVAAEQGVPGVIAYLALLVTMTWALLGVHRTGRFRVGIGADVRASAALAAAAAGMTAMVVHTLGYVGFLTDPATWALLAIAVALRRAPPE